MRYFTFVYYFLTVFFVSYTFKCLADDKIPEIKISFKQQEINNVKLAAFRKGSYTWIVFNKKTESNLADVVKNNQELLKLDVTQDYTILKFKIRDKTPKIYLENNSWVIDFYSQSEALSLPIIPEKKEKDIFLPIQNSERMIDVIDNETQSNILVVPLSYPGYYVSHNYKFVSFNLPKTQNGVVIESKLDKLKIDHNTQGININNIEVDLSNIDSENDVIFAFSKWFVGDMDDYYSTYKKIISEINAASNSTSKLFYRFKLVKFYFAHSLFPEARGYLQYIKKNHPELVKDQKILNEYRLLDMLSLYMTNRFPKAFEVLSRIDQSQFNNKQQAELRFWHDAINIKLQKKDLDIQYIENINTFLPYYLTNNKAFAFLALELALENKQVEKAGQISNILATQNLSLKDVNYLKILGADTLLLGNKSNLMQAISIYDQIIKSSIDDPQNRAWATYKKVMALYKNNQIKLPEAIDMLEKLAVIWRGDEFEAALTYFLSDLYIENKDYAPGLNILRNMLIYYPKYANPLKASKTMNNIFIYLFHQHGADKLPNFDATTLFYDFRELMPIGDVGIEMTLNLVNRLVELDLIDAATFFLNHLVKYRIKNDYQKGDNALNLATIYYHNNQLKEALQVISEYEDVISKNFSQNLRYLKTNTLISLKRYNDALNVIKGEVGEKADSLKSDIFWHAKRWKELQKLAESKLEYRENPPKKLSQLEQEYAFRLAISYASTLNNHGIISLHRAFKDMLDNKLHKKIISSLVKISYLSSAKSLDGYLKQILILYQNANNSIVNSDVN